MSRPAEFSGFLLTYCNTLCNLGKRETRSVRKLFGLVERNMDKLPDRYVKVYEAWLAQYMKTERESRIQDLMRQAMLAQLDDEKGAIGKLCRKCNLNPGNAYAYLRGDVSRVSLATARRIQGAA